uniref:Carboxylic ester hydrolase n=1 Tax=Salarias fasciatus TaxID=181472 RepID=A0A672FW44_SALFA
MLSGCVHTLIDSTTRRKLEILWLTLTGAFSDKMGVYETKAELINKFLYCFMLILYCKIIIPDHKLFCFLQKNGAYSFKGIPYAAPPVGALRWAPPAPPACSSEVTDAGHFRSMCTQVRPLSSTGRLMGQEDCLFINVWTPTLQPGARLPVVVWIHGGYLHMLSGNEPGYSPTEELAADTGVVYVSFNYRVNAFGFLALEVLREGSPRNTSGNYGFLDQIAALQWVQKNIQAFGGDPEKVTIVGHSSGMNPLKLLEVLSVLNNHFPEKKCMFFLAQWCCCFLIFEDSDYAY